MYSPNLRPHIWLLFSLFVLQNAACAPKKTRHLDRSFYIWKSDFRLSQNEKRQLFDTLKITKLYLKYFDVDWSAPKNEAAPLDNMQMNTALPANIKIVPTVFITNTCLQKTDSTKIAELAERIATKIKEKTQNAALEKQVAEWQIDCDWSGSTREKYFHLLKLLQTHLPKQKTILSATIRLHQLKYAKKTGIPPVQRGILMLYNMDKVQDLKTKNSILDLALTKKYISEQSTYPLPLDIALPLFAWSAGFRGERFQGLLNHWTADFCAKQSFLKKTENERFLCVQDTFYNNYYWRRGDIVRPEVADLRDLKALSARTESLQAAQNISVSMFCWDEQMYRYYRAENIKTVFETFE